MRIWNRDRSQGKEYRLDLGGIRRLHCYQPVKILDGSPPNFSRGKWGGKSGNAYFALAQSKDQKHDVQRDSRNGKLIRKFVKWTMPSSL